VSSTYTDAQTQCPRTYPISTRVLTIPTFYMGAQQVCGLDKEFSGLKKTRAQSGPSLLFLLERLPCLLRESWCLMMATLDFDDIDERTRYRQASLGSTWLSLTMHKNGPMAKRRLQGASICARWAAKKTRFSCSSTTFRDTQHAEEPHSTCALSQWVVGES